MTKEALEFKEIIDKLFEKNPLWLYKYIKMTKIAVKLSKDIGLDTEEEKFLEEHLPQNIMVNDINNNSGLFEKKAILGVSAKVLLGTIIGLGALALFLFPLLTIGGAGALTGFALGGGSKIRQSDSLSDYIESEAAKIQIEKTKDLINQVKNLRKKKQFLKDYFDIDIT